MPRAHLAAFRSQLRREGERVTYTKIETGEALELTGLRGQTPFREGPTRNEGGRIIRSADWLFDAADFRGAVGRWALDGDTITAEPPRPIPGLNGITYRATPFNGEPVYRLEPTLTHIRVHAQESAES